MGSVGPIFEETVSRTGLDALRRTIGGDDLLTFPTRSSGAPVLLKQRFFEKMLGSQFDLSNFSAGEIGDAQADIRNLSLSQLLYIRCGRPEAQLSSTSSAQADFMNAVAAALGPKLAERLLSAGTSDISLDPDSTDEVSRTVVLIYGVYDKLEGAKPDYWLFRVEFSEAVLHLPTCTLQQMDAIEVPVFAHSNLCRSSTAVPASRRKLHWEVEVCDDPTSFQEKPALLGLATERRNQRGGEFAARRAAATAGATRDGQVKAAKGADSVAQSEELRAAKARVVELEAMDEDVQGRLREAEARAQASAAQVQQLQAELDTSRKALSQSEAQAKASSSEGHDQIQSLQAELESSRQEVLEAAAKAKASAEESEIGRQLLQAELESSRNAAGEVEARAKASAEEILRLQAELVAARNADVSTQASVPTDEAQIQIQVMQSPEQTPMQSPMQSPKQSLLLAGEVCGTPASAASFRSPEGSPEGPERQLFRNDGAPPAVVELPGEDLGVAEPSKSSRILPSVGTWWQQYPRPARNE